jgi:hypothetical protein
MITPLLFAAVNFSSGSRLWLLPPLIVVVSLVYSASRYEAPQRILVRAARLAAQIAGFMAAILALLAWLSAGL